MPSDLIISNLPKRAASVFWRLISPPLPDKPSHRIIVSALYFAGAFLATVQTPTHGAFIRSAIALLMTGTWLVSKVRFHRVAWNVISVFCAIMTFLTCAIVCNFAWLELELFGWVAGWWYWILFACLAAGVFWTSLGEKRGVRLPAILLLGSCSFLMVLSGSEDGSIRCDDYIRAREQPGVQILIPTSLDELSCVPGDRLSAARYPRRVWEAPGGRRFIITSQDQGQIGTVYGSGRQVPTLFTGSFCEAWTDLTRTPVCFGKGKSDGIVEADNIDRLFVCQWTYDYAERGTVWAVTRDEPMRVIEKRVLPLAAAGGYYLPEKHLLAIGFDEGVGLDFLMGTNLSETVTKVRTYFQGGFFRFDQNHNEGIMCAAGPLPKIDGHHYLSIAMKGMPFETRILGSSEIYPWAIGMLVWGCDWDPEKRTAWISIANLGVVAALNYDTGRLVGGPIAYTRPGVRMVTHDKQRKRLYLSTFTDGEVTAISLEDGRTLGRWFAGRWVRDLVMSRDGRYIYLTSNLGLVRIDIDF